MIFSKKSNNPEFNPAAISILTFGTSMEGTLVCGGSTIINGTVKGKVISHAALVVDANGVLEADIESKDIVISGIVRGNLKSTGKVELKETARFYGNIQAPKLIMEEGSVFKGQFDVYGEEQNEEEVKEGEGV